MKYLFLLLVCSATVTFAEVAQEGTTYYAPPEVCGDTTDPNLGMGAETSYWNEWYQLLIAAANAGAEIIAVGTGAATYATFEMPYDCKVPDVGTVIIATSDAQLSTSQEILNYDPPAERESSSGERYTVYANITATCTNRCRCEYELRPTRSCAQVEQGSVALVEMPCSPSVTKDIVINDNRPISTYLTQRADGTFQPLSPGNFRYNSLDEAMAHVADWLDAECQWGNTTQILPANDGSDGIRFERYTCEDKCKAAIGDVNTLLDAAPEISGSPFTTTCQSTRLVPTSP